MSAEEPRLPEELSGPGTAEGTFPASDLALFEKAVAGLAGDPDHEIHGLEMLKILEELLALVKLIAIESGPLHSCAPVRRSGAELSCGCWYHAMPGTSVGQTVLCPCHDWVTVTQCNLLETWQQFVPRIPA